MTNKCNEPLEPKFDERTMKLNDNFGAMYQREIRYAGMCISKLEQKIWAWKCIEQFYTLKLTEYIGDEISEDMKSYLQCLEIKRDELDAIANERSN